MDERRTDFLYANPSFFEGMARIFDLGGSLNVYNESPETIYADGYAIGMDWYMVGRDIQAAVSAYRDQEDIPLTQ